MDSCVILAAYLKRDVIQETCVNTKPFLNMNEKNGIYYYRIIIVLKMLFVTSIMLRAGSNRFNHLMFALSNALLAIMYSEIALLPAIAQCLLIFAPNKRFTLFLSISWMSILAMNIKSYEFILDLCAVWSLFWYLWEAYKSELQKLWTVIYMMLSLGWYVCGLDVYGLENFFLVIGFLVLAYMPLRPHWHNKHRDRLIFIYALMFLWIVFKFQLFGIQPVVPHFKTVNITEVSRKLESCAVTDNLTCEVGDQFMSAKSLHESNNIESVSFIEDDVEDSNLQKKTQSAFRNILTEEIEVNEECHDDQNMQLDEDKQLEPVEENDQTKNILQAEQTNFRYSSESFRESMEDPLTEISKYENQNEEWHEFIKSDAEIFEVEVDLDENTVEPERNSEKSQIDTSTEELQTTEETDSKEMFLLQTRQGDVVSTNTKHDSLPGPDIKRREKRETAADTSVSDSMFQLIGAVEETRTRSMIKENLYESLTTPDKLNFDKTDERKTQGKMIKEDFTRQVSTENKEENIIKSVFDSKSKLNFVKQVDIRDEIVTLDEKNEDKLKPEEAIELSENEILEFKEQIERNEVGEKEATLKIIKKDEIGAEFTEKDAHGKSEVPDSIEEKSKIFSTQSDSIILHRDQEKTDESQLDNEEVTFKNKKDISNTRLITKNVDGNADSRVDARSIQNKNRKQSKRDTYIVKDELSDYTDMDFVDKERMDAQKVKTLDSPHLQQLKSSDSAQKVKPTVKILPKEVYIKHASDIGKENKVNSDVLNTVEEITLSDELEIPNDSKTRDTVKKTENIEDALQQDGFDTKEPKVNDVRNNLKKEIKIAGNVMERKSKSTNRVERSMKKTMVRDVPNLQRESKSRYVVGHERNIRKEAKRPYVPRMFDFESENISDWEKSFKTHLMQEESGSDDRIALKNSKKQQMGEDQIIMKNLLESFDEMNTDEERLNGLELVEHLRENDPFDSGLTEDYTYLVNENEGFYEDESTEDVAIDQNFEVIESDHSTTNENERNDRMYVVFKKRNGKYYIM